MDNGNGAAHRKSEGRLTVALFALGATAVLVTAIELFLGWTWGSRSHVIHGLVGLGFLAVIVFATIWHLTGASSSAVAAVSLTLIVSGPILSWQSDQHILVPPLLPFAGLLIRMTYGRGDHLRPYLAAVWTSIVAVVLFLARHQVGTAGLWTTRTASTLVAIAAIVAILLFLLDRIHRQARTLQEARTRVARSIRIERERFMGGAAHELNTPLTSMGTMIYLLRKRFAQDDDQLAPIAAALERDHQRMKRLVRALMEATRAGDPAQVHPVPLGATLRESLAPYIRQARRAGSTLSVEVRDEAVVAADPTALQAAVGELVRNAIAFTPSGGRIRVIVAREAGTGIVLVEDTGLGIDPADQERPFLPFQKLHIDQVKERGPGLGLARVRRIVEAHGGEMGFDSAGRDKGSTFWIRFPLVAPSAA